MKKYLLTLLIIPLITQANPYKYTGEFQSIKSSGGPCDSIFTKEKFATQHFFTGPTHLTSVVFFKSLETPGFFNGVSLIGKNDGWGQFRVEREIAKDKLTYRILADGLYDYGFLILDVTASVFELPNDAVLCSATAQFSAFRSN